MACTFDGPFSGRDEECRKELNEATRVACEVLTVLEDRWLPIPTSCKSWWEEHKRMDAIRIERENEQKRREAMASKLEQEKLAAIASLTPQQRKALGL